MKITFHFVRNGFVALVLFLSTGVLAPNDLRAEGDEYALKAAFVWKFLQFIEWPSGPAGGELGLCVTGGSGVLSAFKSLEGRVVKDRRVVLHKVDQVLHGSRCDCLFVHKDASYELVSANPKLLTIGERSGFASNGGVIGFFRSEGKLKFEINQQEARRLGIEISSRLLRLDRIVTSRGGE